jgi:hypothetical protein
MVQRHDFWYPKPSKTHTLQLEFRSDAIFMTAAGYKIRYFLIFCRLAIYGFSLQKMKNTIIFHCSNANILYVSYPQKTDKPYWLIPELQSRSAKLSFTRTFLVTRKPYNTRRLQMAWRQNHKTKTHKLLCD